MPQILSRQISFSILRKSTYLLRLWRLIASLSHGSLIWKHFSFCTATFITFYNILFSFVLLCNHPIPIKVWEYTSQKVPIYHFILPICLSIWCCSRWKECFFVLPQAPFVISSRHSFATTPIIYTVSPVHACMNLHLP